MRDAIAVVESVSWERTSKRTTREMFVDDVSMAEDSCGAAGSQSARLLIRRVPPGLAFASVTCRHFT